MLVRFEIALENASNVSLLWRLIKEYEIGLLGQDRHLRHERHRLHEVRELVGPPDRIAVQLFGSEVAVRCHPDAMPAAGATALLCLRPEHLEPTDGAGFAATVRKATFKGSHVILDVSPKAAPETVLPVWAPHLAAIGSTIRVRAKDGWLLPSGHAAAVKPARAA